MYQTYFGMLIGAVQQFLSVFPALAQGADAIRSLGEVLEAGPLERNEGKPPAPGPLRGEIVFDNVSFNYPRGREVALQDISLNIAAGESGAGKSTLVNLAIGFRQPAAGCVLLDGCDLRELDLQTYRRQIGVVPQTTLLFNGMLRENVTYGLEKVSDDTLWKIMAGANLAEFVRLLPQGLDTPLGESGARLSGGRRPRARAQPAPRHPRRGHVRAGHGIRAAGAGGAGPPHARPHHPHRRPPVFHHPPRAPHHRFAAGTHRGAGDGGGIDEPAGTILPAGTIAVGHSGAGGPAAGET